jgi:hypothetical protein
VPIVCRTPSRGVPGARVGQAVEVGVFGAAVRLCASLAVIRRETPDPVARPVTPEVARSSPSRSEVPASTASTGCWESRLAQTPWNHEEMDDAIAPLLEIGNRTKKKAIRLKRFPYFERALASARELHDIHAESRALHSLGSAHQCWESELEK